MDKIFCDILISGAGIIGSTLALRLVQCGFQVIIIDSSIPMLFSKTCYPDLRVSAINISSVRILQKINVWNEIQSRFCIPFRKLEILENYVSKVIFDSHSLNLPNMGLIVENSRLQCALWKNFLNENRLIFYHPCCLSSIRYKKKFWELKLNNGKIINSLLLIGADGKNSLVRNKIGIGVTKWKYRQFCMVLSITFTKNHNDTVWQVFTSFGPRGFLPLYNNWGALMWYDTLDYIKKLQKLPIIMLEKKLQKLFGEQLGTIKIHKNMYFSLLYQHAHSYVREGLVLVGDSAHTINPLAGQGINLGLKDVDVLVNILAAAKNNEIFWNKLEILKKYQDTRLFNNFSMQMGINCIYIIFSNDIHVVKWTRNISLSILKRCPLLKRYVLRCALGL